MNSYWKRVRFKYRVSVQDENTLGEVWHAHFSLLGVLSTILLLIILTFFIMAAIIWFTPMKRYLPGYEEDVRDDILATGLRVDSLYDQLQLQNRYLLSLKQVVEGSLETDSLQTIDSAAINIDKKNLLETQHSVTDSFISLYENEHSGTLSVFDKPVATTAIPTLFRPCNGTISRGFSEQRPYVEISVAQNMNICCVLRGTIILVQQLEPERYQVLVQHEQEMLSLYQFSGKMLHQLGDLLQTGESIAIATEPGTLEFGLYQKGKVLNPTDFIQF
ncbi:MAG: hypothetical protein IJS73_02380 [Paludibacteraceae bacterium]|nr:hypothetical protein [Paludibacteraceae bacterium]